MWVSTVIHKLFSQGTSSSTSSSPGGKSSGSSDLQSRMEEYFGQLSEQYTTAYQALALTQQLQVTILEFNIRKYLVRW